MKSLLIDIVCSLLPSSIGGVLVAEISRQPSLEVIALSALLVSLTIGITAQLRSSIKGQ